MDDALAVGVSQSRAHLADQPDDPFERKGPHVPVGEASPLHQRHHEVRAVWVPPIVVERHDVGVFKTGDGAGFHLETSNKRWMVGVLGPDHLDRHLSAHGGLECSIDDRYPPGTQTFA